MATDKDELKDALDEFDLCVQTESYNRTNALENLRFAKLGEQWPEEIRKQRELEGRPCLTINRMPSFIRQVVNDGRQNKPAIKVLPADDAADPATAEVMSGLIRNIETTSDAEVAYDTGLDFSVSANVGYWRIKAEYAHDDTFDQDLRICPVFNVFSVYGDPYDQGLDSSGWNMAFVTELLPKSVFQRKYKGAEKVDWNMGDYANLRANWKDGEQILVAERWTRSEVKKKILQLSDGRVVKEDWYLAAVPGGDGITNKDILDSFQVTVQGDRETRSYKVKQQIMSGAEVLETNDWPGIYIPIVAVYGDVVNIEGKRHFRSLIDDAKDPQRMFNYWRTTSTELVALAPKAPFVGPVGSFTTESEKWATANTQTHQYLAYDPVVEGGAVMPPPQRQPFAGVPAGALQEAMNAADDMKAVTGIYDASLGARSNETSGKAIMARQREGDVSTFHFIDNQARAIRHTGRILIDLIPHYYNTERIIRVLGPDKKPQAVPINQPVMGPNGQPQTKPDGKPLIYNLAIGKYDLTVEVGPSFTTKREEAAYQMTEFIRAYPQAAPLIGDMLAKNMDWPEADEIARRLQAMLPPQVQGQNPQVMQMQQQIQQMAQNLAALGAELKAEKEDKELERRKLDIDAYGKETDRLKVMGGGMTPDMVQQMVMQTIQQVMQSPDVLPAAQQAPMGAQMPPQGMHRMPDGSMMPNSAMPQGGQQQMPMQGMPPNSGPPMQQMMNQPQPGQAPGFLLPGQGQ